MIDKTVRSAAEAMQGIADGATVLVGGFGKVGEPRQLIEALIEHGAKDLTIVGITMGHGPGCLEKLMALGRVRKCIASWGRSRLSDTFERMRAEGKVELELVPQGTLAERLRAGGAGVPAFYTATSAGTALGAGKERREFGGRDHVLEYAITGDVGLVESWQADRFGNLTFRAAGRNMNPLCAMAAKLTIAQTEHLLEPGDIDPDRVVVPGIFVDRVVHLPYGGDPRTEDERIEAAEAAMQGSDAA
ncbi:MAG: 3-oxoacid CoA-transferase subunit A [Proteobacteria bacterium]|nr:3-oxoacid CoA-transferase subunit A [Pseudomonadota bacterium]